MNARMIFLAVLVVFGLCGPVLAGWSVPVPVPEVNTEYDEKLPFLSFDGLTLYFVRGDTDTFYYARIYKATRSVPYGPFTSVHNISELNYSGGHVASPWVSPDNLRMYYYRTEPGSNWRLKATERASINDPWQPPVNISELNALGHVYAQYLTEDELTIVFTGWNTPGNMGEFDLWTATRPDRYSPFGNIRNLTEINSAAFDYYPYISPDGLKLYFSSNRNGSWQILRATRGSLIEPFGNPENISFFNGFGTPYFSSDESTFYCGGSRDIYVSYQTEPRTLIGLEIAGPDEVAENSSAGYKAIAHYDNDSTRDVTGLASWNVEPTMAASIEAGVLTTKDIVEGQSATILAGYTEGDVTVGGQKTIHIFALMGIEISGPDDVAENFSAGYKAIAYYDNDSTKNVTDLAFWSVEPNSIASIVVGTLKTEDIVKDQLAIIWAGYTEGDTTFEADKVVDILAICPTGTALSFDGVDDYVDVGDGFADFTNGLSIVLWAYPDYDSIHERFIDFGNGEYNDNILFSRHKSTYSLVFQAYSGNVPGNWVLTGDVIELRTWQHFAVTVNSAGDTVIYKNGIEISNGKTFVPRNVLRTGNYIGKSNWVAESTYKGQLDEIEIFNRALSGEEIWASMHTRLAGDEPGLVGYWDFDEGMGQIAYDLSGNGNDGQLGSTPDVDASDPAWIESDAPVGLCTPYLIATAAAKEALKHKRASLKELEAALAQEWIMYEALEEWLESGDFTDLSKGDIVKAQQKTHSAMQHEEQSIDMLGKGFEKLLDSLSSLGYGPQPPGSNWPPNVTIIKPQNGAEFNPDDTIEIKADAWDYDGSVVSVEFFANGSKIGEDNDGADGWMVNWYDHPKGAYSLTAKATDNEGAATTSAALGIMVIEEPLPPPPPPEPPGPPPPPPPPPPP